MSVLVAEAQVCPGWCVGDHDDVDDFHRSVSSDWRSDRTVMGTSQLVKVLVEQYVEEDGATRSPLIVIDGVLSELQDVAEFTVFDARVLIKALEAACDLADGIGAMQ